MAFNERELFHRRPTATTLLAPRSSDMNRRVRRRKRASQQRYRTICAVALPVTLGLFVLAYTRRGGESKSSVEKWKSRLKSNREKGKREDASISHTKSSSESQDLYRYKFTTSELGYDIYNCPTTPPYDYPRSWPVTDIISDWNPNEVTTISPEYREIYHSLCIFDYQTQYEAALAYRDAEKPFVRV
jgi:hypothetical protein